MKKILLLLCFAAVGQMVSAQDIHFSQFYMAPTNLNPAMTGVMNCNQRLGVNYRNQWASVLRDKAYQTANVSYDAKIPVGRYDFIGVGGYVWGDRAGSLNYHTNHLSGNFSYAKRMYGYRKKASFLVMGAEVSLGNRGVNTLDARWGNQNVDGTFDPNRPTGETAFERDNYIYPDVSAGLLWYSVFDDNKNFYIGGAYDHINRANISFSNNTFVPYNSKFTMHMGGELPTSNRVSLLPSFLVFMQGPATEINGGTSMRFLLGNSKRSTEAVQFGAWARFGNKVGGGMLMDAVILSTRFDYNQFAIGFSYDVNTSSLRPASNSNGAFEFSLQYKVCGKERRGVYCPNF